MIAHRAARRSAARSAAAPQLNLWVRTAPRGAEEFHWHVDIVPAADDRAPASSSAPGSRSTSTRPSARRPTCARRSAEPPMLRTIRKGAWWALSPFAVGTALVARHSGRAVLSGPFEGMRYPAGFVPRLLFSGPYQVGSFELELQPAIERAIGTAPELGRQRRLRRGLLRGRARDPAAVGADGRLRARPGAARGGGRARPPQRRRRAARAARAVHPGRARGARAAGRRGGHLRAHGLRGGRGRARRPRARSRGWPARGS